MSAEYLNRLYRDALSGDLTAQTALFDYLSARFRLFVRHRVWNSVDAEDVVQEALVTICREYKTLEITTSFAAWAYKVLDFRVLAYVRSRKNIETRTVEGADGLDGLPAPAVDSDLQHRLLACLQRICGLNRRYGRALTLHAQGYDTTEICRRIEIKENTFYSLLHRGRAMLQHCLETGEIK
ncbi:hypothetical protein C3F09_12345 [candidate division GN15 bacterium]|uniref:Sigma-70 family RNA polymerase sigma factor n=1 Tax=candidate division GN15 bacterium TaxID=2072418 RepID=A0A855WU50_9BACT|nr:MAG: hypothetical protein C3F09_12345 [candidate division GN15 bacterium]